MAKTILSDSQNANYTGIPKAKIMCTGARHSVHDAINLLCPTQACLKKLTPSLLWSPKEFRCVKDCKNGLNQHAQYHKNGFHPHAKYDKNDLSPHAEYHKDGLHSHAQYHKNGLHPHGLCHQIVLNSHARYHNCPKG